MAKSKHTIRIISGALRGRRIPVVDVDGLRPTGDRLRETLFNWLQFEIAGTNVLDLCAGSGALGFEAVSRGAKNVTMVEMNVNAIKQLKHIKQELCIENLHINNQTAQNFLKFSSENYDLIFLDPPFTENLLEDLTELSLSRVNVNGFLYREFALDQEIKDLPNNWKLYRQKKAGQVKIELWQKES